MDEGLQRLAALHGVSTAYSDIVRGWVDVGEDTVRAVLEALEVDTADPAAAAEEAEAAAWRRVLPEVTVTRQGVGGTVTLHLPAGSRASATVEGSDGKQHLTVWGALAGRTVDGRPLELRHLVLPLDLEPGDAELVVRAAGVEHRTPLIVAPRAVRTPRRGWGWTTQLYQVRSGRSWGIGDLADLAELAETLAGAGGDPTFLLTEPFHSPAPASAIEPSPYFPATRLFTSPLLIAVEDVVATARAAPALAGPVAGIGATPGEALARARAAAEAARPSLDAAHLAALSDAARAASHERLDRDAVWTAKREALEAVFAGGRWEGFAAWRAAQGPALERWALWCALAEDHGPRWTTWPAALRHPGGPGVAAAARARADRATFHAWLQWVADGQRAAALERAVAAGMVEGLVADLAVGVSPEGADAWALQDDLALGVSVGAPPDFMNALGQDWRQPPLRPDRLQTTAYAPFREIVRHAVRHAGGLRVDHVAGLFRQWWVPAGAAPDQGTYVAMPSAALLDVLVAEAAAAGAFVVGEDLGNVPSAVRPALAERGMLGNRVVWFERHPTGRRLAAREYPRQSLVMVTTHDLPTAAGWWSGAGAALQSNLGLLPGTTTDEAYAAAAQRERDELWEVLADQGEAPDGVDDLVVATYRFAARTPCRLVGVALADAVGDRRQPNLPGTIDEYPNWRLPLTDAEGAPVALEDLAGNPGLAALATAVGASRAKR